MSAVLVVSSHAPSKLPTTRTCGAKRSAGRSQTVEPHAGMDMVCAYFGVVMFMLVVPCSVSRWLLFLGRRRLDNLAPKHGEVAPELPFRGLLELLQCALLGKVL